MTTVQSSQNRSAAVTAVVAQHLGDNNDTWRSESAKNIPGNDSGHDTLIQALTLSETKLSCTATDQTLSSMGQKTSTSLLNDIVDCELTPSSLSKSVSSTKLDESSKLQKLPSTNSSAVIAQTLSLQFHKTRMCPFFERGHCRKSTDCTYAHDKEELKCAPDLFKTKLCEEWQQGNCHLQNCRFAHGRQELRFTNQVYKTRICHFWSTGDCTKGNLCRHAHGYEELRGSPTGSDYDSQLCSTRLEKSVSSICLSRHGYNDSDDASDSTVKQSIGKIVKAPTHSISHSMMSTRALLHNETESSTTLEKKNNDPIMKTSGLNSLASRFCRLQQKPHQQIKTSGIDDELQNWRRSNTAPLETTINEPEELKDTLLSQTSKCSSILSTHNKQENHSSETELNSSFLWNWDTQLKDNSQPPIEHIMSRDYHCLHSLSSHDISLHHSTTKHSDNNYINSNDSINRLNNKNSVPWTTLNQSSFSSSAAAAAAAAAASASAVSAQDVMPTPLLSSMKNHHIVNVLQKALSCVGLDFTENLDSQEKTELNDLLQVAANNFIIDHHNNESKNQLVHHLSDQQPIIQPTIPMTRLDYLQDIQTAPHLLNQMEHPHQYDHHIIPTIQTPPPGLSQQLLQEDLFLKTTDTHSDILTQSDENSEQFYKKSQSGCDRSTVYETTTHQLKHAMSLYDTINQSCSSPTLQSTDHFLYHQTDLPDPTLLLHPESLQSKGPLLHTSQLYHSDQQRLSTQPTLLQNQCPLFFDYTTSLFDASTPSILETLSAHDLLNQQNLHPSIKSSFDFVNKTVDHQDNELVLPPLGHTQYNTSQLLFPHDQKNTNSPSSIESLHSAELHFNLIGNLLESSSHDHLNIEPKSLVMIGGGHGDSSTNSCGTSDESYGSDIQYHPMKEHHLSHEYNHLTTQLKIIEEDHTENTNQLTKQTTYPSFLSEYLNNSQLQPITCQTIQSGSTKELNHYQLEASHQTQYQQPIETSTTFPNTTCMVTSLDSTTKSLSKRMTPLDIASNRGNCLGINSISGRLTHDNTTPYTAAGLWDCY